MHSLAFRADALGADFLTAHYCMHSHDAGLLNIQSVIYLLSTDSSSTLVNGLECWKLSHASDYVVVLYEGTAVTH